MLLTTVANERAQHAPSNPARSSRTYSHRSPPCHSTSPPGPRDVKRDDAQMHVPELLQRTYGGVVRLVQRVAVVPVLVGEHKGAQGPRGGG